MSPSTPVPVPDEVSEPYWEAAGRQVLVMQRCESCGAFSYPPVRVCTVCHSPREGFTWEPVSGRARLKTWTVMRQAFLPGFDADVPYVVGEVELAEQADLRMVGRLVGVAPDDLEIGMALRVAFDDVGDTAVPYFEPAEEPHA